MTDTAAAGPMNAIMEAETETMASQDATLLTDDVTLTIMDAATITTQDRYSHHRGRDDRNGDRRTTYGADDRRRDRINPPDVEMETANPFERADNRNGGRRNTTDVVMESVNPFDRADAHNGDRRTYESSRRYN